MTDPNRKAEIQRWEYWVINSTGESAERALRPAGNEGWELVAATVQLTSTYLYLKRPITDSGLTVLGKEQK